MAVIESIFRKSKVCIIKITIFALEIMQRQQNRFNRFMRNLTCFCYLWYLGEIRVNENRKTTFWGCHQIQVFNLGIWLGGKGSHTVRFILYIFSVSWHWPISEYQMTKMYEDQFAVCNINLVSVYFVDQSNNWFRKLVIVKPVTI